MAMGFIFCRVEPREGLTRFNAGPLAASKGNDGSSSSRCQEALALSETILDELILFSVERGGLKGAFVATADEPLFLHFLTAIANNKSRIDLRVIL